MEKSAKVAAPQVAVCLFVMVCGVDRENHRECTMAVCFDCAKGVEARCSVNRRNLFTNTEDMESTSGRN